MTDTTASSLPEAASDDQLARRNALILALAQGCSGYVITTAFVLGGLVGSTLNPDPSLATLPITTMMIGTFAATLPMSLLMQRFGRRFGLMLGAAAGILGSLVCVLAIERGSFALFCLGTHFCGYYGSSANYYRFVATDTASPAFRPTAVSLALAGGLLAALITPEILTRTRELWLPFAACFMAGAVSAMLGMLLVSLVRVPLAARPVEAVSTGRPLLEIIRQPRFITALAAGTVAYGMMSLVMTATPLAMAACNFTPDDASHAIRWHVLAMYVPSFFTGALITRFGRIPVALTGLVLLVVCGLIALSGVSIFDFIAAMVALGLGWNFSYISATTMVTDCHTPEERGKTQAFNEMTVFGFVAIATYLSGRLLSSVGWNGVNIAIFPVVALVASLILALPFIGKRTAG